MATYLHEINDTPLLTANEEKALAGRIKGGNQEALDRMVRANLRLVVSIARGFAHRGAGLDDLIAEGNVGLIHAAEMFDPDRNTRFSTYASYWIKHAIRHFLVRATHTVRSPDYTRMLLIRWRRAAAGLHEQLQRQPTEEEVGQALHWSAKKLNIVNKALHAHNAQTLTGRPGAEQFLENNLTEQGTISLQARIIHTETCQQVLELVEQLVPRQATVMRLRFGLDGETSMTLKAIGERLGMTRERVRQIEREALQELKKSLEAN